jgi:hypothetical protein
LPSPSIATITPSDESVLQIGSQYLNINNIHPSVKIENYNPGTVYYYKYRIEGPGVRNAENSEFSVVYNAKNEIDPTNDKFEITQNGVTQFTQATGLIAMTSPDNNGAIDLATNASLIRGGEYRAITEMFDNSNTLITSKVSVFNIALQNDLAVSGISSFTNGTIFEYGLRRTPVSVKIKNVGVYPILGANVVSKILRANVDYATNAILGWDTVKIDTVRWRSVSNPMLITQSREVSLPDFVFPSAAQYKISINTELYGANDEFLGNNVFPRVGDPEYKFNVRHKIELAADSVVAPFGKLNYVGIPLRPLAYFRNYGTMDTAKVVANLTIRKILPSGYQQPVGYESRTSTVQDLQANDFGFTYFDDFEPSSPGTYIATINIPYQADPVQANNIKSFTFTVQPQLGNPDQITTYTIGEKFSTRTNNFRTIKSAIDTLYTYGVAGPLVFELTDNYYETSDDLDNSTATIDLTAKIVGVSERNTITFKPYIDRSYAKSDIVIRMKSKTGVGLRIGQSVLPSNQNAALYKVRESKKSKFANTAGNIIIDGGLFKAIDFQLETANKHRVAVYLGSGASNVTIKNCIIEDVSSTKTNASSLPLNYYLTSASTFVFQPDIRPGNTTYTAGIVMRSTSPFDKDGANRLYNLDTTANVNNTIYNNEISNFSYGIASLGIGLLMDDGLGKYFEKFNKNNLIKDNIITSVHRAGIFMGNDSNSLVLHNRIYQVDGLETISSGGILCGGEGDGGNGYYNRDLKIQGNEISKIDGNDEIYGIKIETNRNNFPYGLNSYISFPIEEERISITNNVIWDIRGSKVSASKYGVRVMTDRAANSTLTQMEKLLSPSPNEIKSRIKNTLIANNTIVIDGDSPIMNTGALAGIAVQNAKNTRVYSNAISFRDTDISPNAMLATCLFLENEFPDGQNFVSDRNAYEIVSGSPATTFRFIEIDTNSSIVEMGNYDDYKNIRQWQNWIFNDLNSQFGNFSNDLVVTPDPTYIQTLRVRTLPETPLASILNNYGQQLYNEVPKDIDGHPRGEAGQRCDIGACEFSGRNYNEDLSLENIIEPSRYQRGSGIFGDAEYIMQKPPYHVTALIRNNGTNSRSNVPVRFTLSLEQPNGSYAVVDSVDTLIGVASDAAIELTATFPTSNKVPFPYSYQTLIDTNNARNVALNYTVPSQFVGMKNNVTPKYKINVKLFVAESRNDNNEYTKILRYYVPKSKMNMLVSSVNPSDIITATSEATSIAGRLNVDSLTAGLKTIGWYNKVDSINNYDIFDRNGWEERTVNYSIYNTMFWSDGDNMIINRYQTKDLLSFMKNGGIDHKVNLIFASEEAVRIPFTTKKDTANVKEVLKAVLGAKPAPLMTGDNMNSYSGKKIVGSAIGSGLEELISNTEFTGDKATFPALVVPAANSDAVSLPAYKFKEADQYSTAPNSIAAMGVASSGLTKNIIYLSADWRHFKNNNRLFLSILDYLQRNSANIVPVEIANFEAQKFENRVELAWTTAWEKNTRMFEVEKASYSEAGKSAFGKIAEMPAANMSSSNTEYGPVVDRNVSKGSKYAYRLKTIDLDGQVNYSNEVEVDYFNNSEFMFNEIRPNPVKNSAKVLFSNSKEGLVDISIYNLDGALVAKAFNGVVKAGENEVIINTSELANGSYNMIITNGNNVVAKQIIIAK